MSSVPDSSSVVYFIQDTHSHAIKIGISTNVTSRLAQLQTSSPHKLILLGTLPGGREEEQKLHQHFAHGKKSGEWFEPIEELCWFIERLTGKIVARPTKKPAMNTGVHPPTPTRHSVKQRTYDCFLLFWCFFTIVAVTMLCTPLRPYLYDDMTHLIVTIGVAGPITYGSLFILLRWRPKD